MSIENFLFDSGQFVIGCLQDWGWGVDPHGRRRHFLGWQAENESFWMGGVSGFQCSSSTGDNVGVVSVVDRCWSEHAEAGVVMVVVVPGEELCTVGQGFVVGCKSIGEIGLVFEGLELAFRKRIVVGDAWSTVRFDDAQRGQ